MGSEEERKEGRKKIEEGSLEERREGRRQKREARKKEGGTKQAESLRQKVTPHPRNLGRSSPPKAGQRSRWSHWSSHRPPQKSGAKTAPARVLRRLPRRGTPEKAPPIWRAPSGQGRPSLASIAPAEPRLPDPITRYNTRGSVWFFLGGGKGKGRPPVGRSAFSLRAGLRKLGGGGGREGGGFGAVLRPRSACEGPMRLGEGSLGMCGAPPRLFSHPPSDAPPPLGRQPGA